MSSWPRGKEPMCPICGTNAIRSREARCCGQCNRDPGWHREEASASQTEPLRLSFEEAWQQWMKAIGMAQDRYVRKDINPVTRPDGKEKILIVPDLHVPFHESEMFAAMLARESDANRAICIGDVGDAYALSRFVKYEHCSYRDEWAAMTLVMQELASRFPQVDVVIGNHDTRLEKQLRTHLTGDMVDAIACMTGGILCPLTALCKRYPNVSIAQHMTPGGRAVNWFTTLGDAWLGHPEKFSKVPGSALRALEDWLLDNLGPLGLDRYRLIVLGHTHQLTILPWRSDQLLVECGTLAQTQGYMVEPTIRGRPQKRGYITFEQTNGVTDLNSVKMFWFDVAEDANGAPAA